MRKQQRRKSKGRKRRRAERRKRKKKEGKWERREGKTLTISNSKHWPKGKLFVIYEH